MTLHHHHTHLRALRERGIEKDLLAVDIVASEWMGHLTAAIVVRPHSRVRGRCAEELAAFGGISHGGAI
jgi:hypothetical protein